MVYLIGVDHQVQHNGLPMTPDRETATRNFCKILKLSAKKLDISMLAEEFNEDALRMSKATTATVRDAADCLGLKHLFCDPTRQERKDLGINNDPDLREQFWLSRLGLHLNNETILFVCGADHLESFRGKLLANGVTAEILAEQHGIGLTPPETILKSGAFLDL